MPYTHDPQDLTPEMTADDAPAPYVVSASSFFAGYPPWKIFDHVPSPIPNSSLWLTFIQYPNELPQWVEFDFGPGAQIIINHYKQTNIGAAAGVGNLNNPRDWIIKARKDGEATYDDLDARSDIDWVIDETKEFTFSNATPYRYLREHITDWNPASYPFLAIAEIELFGYFTQGPEDRLIQYRRTRRPGPVAGI